MKVRVHFPIELTVDAGALEGAALDRLRSSLFQIIEQQWLHAQYTLQAQGIPGEARIASITFGWKGPSRRQFSEPERRAIEKRLESTVQGATRTVVPSRPPREWTHFRIEFEARFGALVALLREHHRRTDELKLRHRLQWDDKVQGIAWVATVRRAMPWSRLHDFFRDQCDRAFGQAALFGALPDAARVEELRVLDRQRLRSLPRLVDPAGGARVLVDSRGTVVEGTRVVFVALKPPVVAEDFRIRGFAFRPRYGDWLDLLEPLNRDDLREQRQTYADVLSERVDATAWVIDVQRAISRDALYEPLKANAKEVLGPHHSWFAILPGAASSMAALRRLDAKALAALPDPLAGLPSATGSNAPSIGSRLIFAAAKLPALALGDLVELSPRYVARLPFVLARGLVDPATVARVYRISRAELDAYLEKYGSDELEIRVLPFRVRRRTSDVALRAFLLKLAGDQHLNADFFAAIVRLAAAAQGRDGAPLRADLASALDDLALHREWKPGELGALLYAVIDDQRIRHGAAAQAQRPQLSAVADRIVQVLGFDVAERHQALIDVFRSWGPSQNPLAVEQILDELERRGQLGRLFEVLNSDSHRTWLAETRIRVLGIVERTRYQGDPRVQRVAHAQTALTRGAVLQLTVDVDANDNPLNLRFTRSGEKVFTAGNSKDPSAGVISEVAPYFSTVAPVSQPKPTALARLQAPTKKKVGDLMAAMMCGKGETRTREQLVAQAMEEASKELQPPLTKDDFVRVQMRLSLRVRRIERRPWSGIHVYIVHAERVRKFGDGEWETIGPPEELTLNQLDGEMMGLHVDHLMALMTTIALGAAVLVGTIFVAATGGAGGLLLLGFAVTVRELIYYFTTDAADRDLDGYLTAALWGVLDVVGFRVGGMLAGKLAQAVVSRYALEQAATKWILYIGKGLVVSSVQGVTQVLEKFANDLFHLTSCRRWSSPWEYFVAFGYGFAIGLAFEFAVAPALGVGLRATIRGLSKLKASVKDTAEVLMRYMSPGELENLLERALPKLSSALENTMKGEKAGVVKQLVDGLKKQLDEVVAHATQVAEPKGLAAKLKAEWTSRAVKDLFEAAQVRLGPNATTALDRLIRSVGPDDMSRILDTTLHGHGVRELLERQPDAAALLLGRTYRGSPDELERLLVSLRRASEDDAQAVLAAMTRAQGLSELDRQVVTWLSLHSPRQLAAFLRIAETQELRSLLRFLTSQRTTSKEVASSMQEISSALLDEASRHPKRLGAVTRALTRELDAGELPDAGSVRRLFQGGKENLAEQAQLAQQRALRKGATPDETARSIEKGERFTTRQRE
ncbi:MAG: hypothetical protein ACTHU0_03645, partial [Kofleriaceae bacterium]